MSLPRDINAIKDSTAATVALLAHNNELLQLIVETFISGSDDDPEVLKSLVARLKETKEKLAAGVAAANPMDPHRA